jgi:hypothetical protein
VGIHSGANGGSGEMDGVKRKSLWIAIAAVCCLALVGAGAFFGRPETSVTSRGVVEFLEHRAGQLV